MRVVKRKSIQKVREEKGQLQEMEQSVTELEIEGYKKDAQIEELERTVAEGEQAITDLEIEIAKLKGEA